nr:3064_t:CDS:1 [Entrophospora candida]CAG8639095.1 15706_t:CDS:1 [Entrophospora candida]
MVNAQQYIENNFPKRVSEIIAINKNLEGHLDLSEYPNLTRVDIGINSRLISLKLPLLSEITQVSICDTGITDFSFLINLPNIRFFCFPKPAVSDGNNAEVARAIRNISQASRNKNGEKD